MGRKADRKGRERRLVGSESGLLGREGQMNFSVERWK